jgi:hypothetical protein
MDIRRVRAPIVAIVVVALAVGGWLGWRHATRFHEHVNGARGAFPAALASQAPSTPDRVVRRTSGSYGVDGALSIDTASDGIVARNLLTGKEYWHYGRDRTELGTVGFTGGGGTVATWWKDGVVVGTDVRSGKARWHAKVSYGEPDGAGDQDFAAVRVISGLVVTESRDELTAFGEDNGKRVWSAALPKGCDLSSGGVFAVRAALVARAQCAGPDKDAGQLLAFDVRRGTLRWRVTNGVDQLSRADDHTLVTSLWTGLGVGAVVDVSGSKPVVRTRSFPDDHPLISAGDGIMLCDDNSAKTSDGALEGFGVADGRPRWTRHAAKDTRFGYPLMADGRVYVVQQPVQSRDESPGAGPADLLVFDARTGRQLHAMRLPTIPQDSASQDTGSTAVLAPWQAGHGVVAIGWEGMFSGITGDLLVVAK